MGKNVPNSNMLKDGQTSKSRAAENTGMQPEAVTAGRRTKEKMFEVCVHGRWPPVQKQQFAGGSVSRSAPCLT